LNTSSLKEGTLTEFIEELLIHLTTRLWR